MGFLNIRNILVTDRSVAEFCSIFDSEITVITSQLEHIESCFEQYFSEPEKQKYKWVQEFTFMTIESVVTATRLLIEGHINASGNTMRISYESICLAILLSAESNVVIDKGKKAKPINFYKAYEQGKSNTKAHRAVDNVLLNASTLGLVEGSEWLKQAKNFYNGYSHASITTMSSLMLPSGKPIIAGGFHKEKLDLYKDHLQFIVRYANHLPKLIEAIALRNLTSN
ncbi:hypothetical protein FIU82_05125 [Pseudoalteromonas sp. THAF3]|uniref:hypothetical protein n=1 Tax=Pseudoalteromonas sp. THAF3 TaxID=2587843 RepID=UPI001267FCB3|nr:hypothetical protein [Pseudoalteromonas sp. THAF3]QFU04404.1 hypothetical protein FIU82_05125 [Pseudoalteromonas sp. THAF3]